MPVQGRRNSTRSRVLRGAKIILGTSSVMDCVVRNVTKSGARLQITNTVELPEDLGLTFDGGRSIRECRVVWRTVSETGVKFVRR
jgi:hypothetical protein